MAFKNKINIIYDVYCLNKNLNIKFVVNYWVSFYYNSYRNVVAPFFDTITVESLYFIFGTSAYVSYKFFTSDF